MVQIFNSQGTPCDLQIWTKLTRAFPHLLARKISNLFEILWSKRGAPANYPASLAGLRPGQTGVNITGGFAPRDSFAVPRPTAWAGFAGYVATLQKSLAKSSPEDFAVREPAAHARSVIWGSAPNPGGGSASSRFTGESRLSPRGEGPPPLPPSYERSSFVVGGLPP